MKNFILVLFSVVCLAAVVNADQTETFDWEDGVSTALAVYGDGDPPMILTVVQDPVHGGVYSLELEDNAPSGTPSAYVAWIKGLQDGDEVTGSFWRYDVTPGGSPSCRIWAHWNDDPVDIMGYDGSASGNAEYGEGLGWDETSYTWTVADGHTGLVIEARTYSSDGDIVWIDDLTVTAPDGAEIILPGEVGVNSASWGEIKADFK